MYLKHFNLLEKPFSLTPDTQLFLNKNCHKSALNTILLALQEGEGFLKIVGEVGTGKTLLCRKVLGFLNKSEYLTAFIPNPWLTPDELKLFLASEIGAEVTSGMHSHDVTAAIYRRLVQIARQKKKVVLLIDEAQAMPVQTIESLRLLTNLEGEKRKLLHVVIFGQPELDQILRQKDLRQLQQRIVFSERLVPLNLEEVKEYVNYRLSSCGAKDKLFTASAVWLLAKSSGGIPRLINIVAHKALISAYGRGEHMVCAWHVARAILDTQETTARGRLLSTLWRYPRRIVPQRTAGALP